MSPSVLGIWGTGRLGDEMRGIRIIFGCVGYEELKMRYYFEKRIFFKGMPRYRYVLSN